MTRCDFGGSVPGILTIIMSGNEVRSEVLVSLLPNAATKLYTFSTQPQNEVRGHWDVFTPSMSQFVVPLQRYPHAPYSYFLIQVSSTPLSIKNDGQNDNPTQIPLPNTPIPIQYILYIRHTHFVRWTLHINARITFQGAEFLQ